MYTMKDNQHYQRDLFMDALIYSIVFYILSEPNTYKFTANVFPKAIKDRTFLHAFVFAVAYTVIRLVLKR